MSLFRKSAAPTPQIPASFQLGVLVNPQYAQWKDQFFGVADGKVIGVLHYDSNFSMFAFGVPDRYVREVVGERHVDESFVEIVFKHGRRYLPMNRNTIAGIEKMPHQSTVYTDKRLFMETLRGIRGRMVQEGTRDEYALRDFDEFVLNAEVCGGLPRGVRFLYDDRPKPPLISW